MFQLFRLEYGTLTVSGSAVAEPDICISADCRDNIPNTVTEDQTKEKYLFDGNGNCTGYRKAEYDNESAQYLVVAAEEYTHNPYWIGDEQQSDPKEVVVSAARSSLYTTALGSYSFVSGDTETTVINQFNNPVSKTTNEILLSVWKDPSGTEQQNSQKTTVDYTYDDNQKLIEEKTTVRYTNPIRSFVSCKRYNYNSFGDVIRTETFVENEENKTGKTIEETVYDEKGNVTRSFTYNSLDSSTKFYTESEYTYDGIGRIISEKDLYNNEEVCYTYDNKGNILLIGFLFLPR